VFGVNNVIDISGLVLCIFWPKYAIVIFLMEFEFREELLAAQQVKNISVAGKKF
jgi:hypothetical protein